MHLSSFILTALCLLPQTDLAESTAPNNVSSPTPISFQPSNYWDGNDGAWSTFVVQIGTPPQAVRLLPSITSSTIWAVWSYACTVSDLLDCPAARGNVFNMSASRTWETEGNYSLPLNPQHYLPYSGGAVLGFDNITFGWQGYGGTHLAKQVTFVYAVDDFYIGRFGLSPAPTNISSFNNPIPSIVGSLRQNGLIPSTSWGYLAGAFYYPYPILGLGSLTIGGYDVTRLNANANLTLAGGTDPFRPFLLGLESIITDNTNMLMEPIITALDSLTTQIWLPISACHAFESAFNLVWNETYQLYLLSEAQHSALVAKNASVTFTLSTGLVNSTERLNITLPYAAFDLKASPPLAGNDTFFYFPLKQAANNTQYTLGRVILQEIYMIADYDWGYITLYEAVYPELSVKPQIVAICPPNSTTCIGTPKSSVNSRKLPAGATAGIVIAAILLCVAAVAAIRFKYFRKSNPIASLTEGEGESQPTSMATYSIGTSETPELDGKALGSPRSELEGYFKPGRPGWDPDSGYNSVSLGRAQSSSTGGLSPSSGRGRDEASETGTRQLHELYGELQTSANQSELTGSSPHHEQPASAMWLAR